MFTELYREEKREEGDRGGQEDKMGSERRETDPASNQFPKCSPLSGTQRDSQSWVEKRRGREEIEVTWWKKESPKQERAVKPVILLLSKNGY